MVSILLPPTIPELLPPIHSGHELLLSLTQYSWLFCLRCLYYRTLRLSAYSGSVRSSKHGQPGAYGQIEWCGFWCSCSFLVYNCVQYVLEANLGLRVGLRTRVCWAVENWEWNNGDYGRMYFCHCLANCSGAIHGQEWWQGSGYLGVGWCGEFWE